MGKLLIIGLIVGPFAAILLQGGVGTVGVGEWANLLVQIPLVGVFIWFTLQFLKLQREERDQTATKAREERMQRDKEWRSWLTSEQEKNSTALVALVGETRTGAMVAQEVIEANAIQLNSMRKVVTKQTAVLMLSVAAQVKNGDTVGIKEIVEMLQE